MTTYPLEGMMLCVRWWVAIMVRKVTYRNNMVEKDYRAVRRMACPKMELGNFDCARAIIADIETMHMNHKWWTDEIRLQSPHFI